MTFGSLFAGIGGFDLGLERAGMTPTWQVEIDPFCRAVLAKHWPQVRRCEDVRTVHARGLCGGGQVCDGCVEPVDLLCGGFPCQDISDAGRRAGIDGARSGLWSEYARLIGELRPRFVLVENVTALLRRGMGRVLGDLAALGFDAEWDCIPATAVRAPHRRDRVWILAYPNSERLEGRHGDSVSERPDERPARSRGASLAHADNQSEPGRAFNASARASLQEFVGRNQWWRVEPAVGRVAHGIPRRVDRLRALGNAVVPQIPEWIGRRILEVEAERVA